MIPRIFIELNKEMVVGQSVKISAADLHHIVNVLRLHPADQIHLVNRSDSQLWLAELEISQSEGSARLISLIKSGEQPSRIATLSFGLCKGDHNDMVVEKCVELGVQNIWFFEAEHSVAKLKGKDSGAKVARWQKIALSAAKQCGRLSVPNVVYYPELTTLIEGLSGIREEQDRFFICSLAKDSIPLRKVSQPTQSVHLLIGPEGDFSRREEEMARNFGFEPIRLGSNTLRAETAAIASTAMVEGLWGRES